MNNRQYNNINYNQYIYTLDKSMSDTDSDDSFYEVNIEDTILVKTKHNGYTNLNKNKNKNKKKKNKFKECIYNFCCIV